MPANQSYKVEIIVEGQDKASGPLGGVGGVLGKIGTIASGILGAQLFMKIGQGILDLGRNAIQSTADMQSMQVGMEALLAREISRGKTKEELTSRAVSLSAEEKLKILELGQQYDELSGKVQTTKQQYDSVVASSGANSEAALRLQIELKGLNGDLTSTNAQLGALKDKQDGAVLVMENITTGAMTIKDAMPQARIEAEKLLKQIRTLAIQSPFELSTVQNTFRMGMAFGFTGQESMAFTRGLLNTAAGVGATNDMLDRMAYNLAQVRLQGKVTAMDVRQLAQAGFDLNGALIDIAKQSGYTITGYQDFNKLMAEGKLKWSDFASSFEKYADTQFGGASKRLSQTWNGLKSNFKDVFALTMPAIMGPALEQVTGFLNGLMTGFINFSNSGELEKIGQKIGTTVQGILDEFGKVQTFFRDLGNGNSLDASFLNSFDIKLPPGVQTAIDTITGMFDRVRTSINTAMPDIQNGVTNFKSFFKGNGEEIGNIISENALGLLQTFSDLVSDLSDRVMPFLAEKFYAISSWFAANGPLIQNFLTVIGTIANAIFTAFSAVVIVLWDAVQPILSAVIDAVLGIAKTIMQIFTGDFAGAFATFQQLVVNLAGSIWEGLTNLLNGILGWFGTSLPQLGAKIAEGWANIKTNAITWWTNIKTAISDKFTEIKTNIATFVTEAIQKVKDKIADWTQTGKDMIQGLWNGIKEKVQEVKDWLKGTWDDIIASAKRILGIASPSTVFAGIGDNLMAGLAKGISKGVEMPITAVGDASTQITQVAPGLLGGNSSSVRSSTQNIFNVNGAQDPRAVAQEIMDILKGQGIIKQGAY